MHAHTFHTQSGMQTNPKKSHIPKNLKNNNAESKRLCVCVCVDCETKQIKKQEEKFDVKLEDRFCKHQQTRR